MNKNRKVYICLMRFLMLFSTIITVALLLFLFGYVIFNGIPNITWKLISSKPSYLAEK